MAKRPIFIPQLDGSDYIKEKIVEFKWISGMSLGQQQKCIRSLHDAAKKIGIKSIFEISTKSEHLIGKQLSAFNLSITLPNERTSSVEAAFQSSKVFEFGGPFIDFYNLSGREIKKDARLRESGSLLRFEYFNDTWDLEPKTAFYDWLYIDALKQNPNLSKELLEFSAFTDIAFNPKKSFNCQARAAALFVSISKRNLLKEEFFDKEDFIKTFYQTNTDNLINLEQLSF